MSDTFAFRITDDTGAFCSVVLSLVCAALIALSLVVQVTTQLRPQPITLEELAAGFDARTE